jgi:hypothetical protein
MKKVMFLGRLSNKREKKTMFCSTLENDENGR